MIDNNVKITILSYLSSMTGKEDGHSPFSNGIDETLHAACAHPTHVNVKVIQVSSDPKELDLSSRPFFLWFSCFLAMRSRT
jgi:hypothetical protein